MQVCIFMYMVGFCGIKIVTKCRLFNTSTGIAKLSYLTTIPTNDEKKTGLLCSPTNDSAKNCHVAIRLCSLPFSQRMTRLKTVVLPAIIPSLIASQ